MVACVVGVVGVVGVDAKKAWAGSANNVVASAAAQQERIASHGACSANAATKIAVHKVGVLFFIIRSFMAANCARRSLEMRGAFRCSV